MLKAVFAQNYFGSLQDSANRAGGWNYLRPEEQRRTLSPEHGKMAMPNMQLSPSELTPAIAEF